MQWNEGICDSASVVVVDETLRGILNMTRTAKILAFTLRVITLLPAP